MRLLTAKERDSARSVFQSLGLDKDGMITRAEWRQAQQSWFLNKDSQSCNVRWAQQRVGKSGRFFVCRYNSNLEHYYEYFEKTNIYDLQTDIKHLQKFGPFSSVVNSSQLQSVSSHLKVFSAVQLILQHMPIHIITFIKVQKEWDKSIYVIIVAAILTKHHIWFSSANAFFWNIILHWRINDNGRTQIVAGCITVRLE